MQRRRKARDVGAAIDPLHILDPILDPVGAAKQQLFKAALRICSPVIAGLVIWALYERSQRR